MLNLVEGRRFRFLSIKT